MMTTTPNIGARVQNTIGLWFEIVEVITPFVFRVQPLTMVGVELRPIGAPVRAWASELRIEAAR